MIYEDMKKRFILLDYYKIIFIFLIAIGHFQQFFDISNTHNEIMLSRSYVYVEFFFLTSGFLLGRKIIESDFKFEFLDTVKKRLKQIYLDYFLSVFICALSIVLLKSKPICEVLFSVFGEVTFINSLGIDLGRTNAPAWFLSALMASTFFLLLIVKGLIQIGENKIGIMLLMISIMSYSYIHFLTGAGIGYTLSERINCMIPIGTIRALGGG